VFYAYFKSIISAIFASCANKRVNLLEQYRHLTSKIIVMKHRRIKYIIYDDGDVDDDNDNVNTYIIVIIHTINIIIIIINVIYMAQIRIDAANAPCRLLQAM